MLKRILLITLIIICSPATPLYAQEGEETVDSETILAEYSQYETGKIELNSGNFRAAIHHYNTLRNTYPDSPYIPQANLETAYAYYKLGNTEAVINILSGFFDDNFNHPHKPYAYYLAGLTTYQDALRIMESGDESSLQFKQAGQLAERSIRFFNDLIKKFPGSRYNSDAEKKSDYLLEKLVIYRIKVEEKGISRTRPHRIQAESDTTIEQLLKLPPNNYTLQITRTPDYDTAFKVAAQYKLAKQASIIETYNSNGKSYTLLYGIYPAKGEAMEAGSNLPKAVLNAQPEVKSLAVIQKEIRASKLIEAGLKRETVVAATHNEPPKEKPPASPFPTTGPLSLPKGNSNIKRETWLMEQDPRHLTIQLSAAGSEQNILAFINQHRLAGKVAYYKSIRKGKEWYSLLFGSYTDRREAVTSAKQIAAQLGINEPWIRSFKGIQTAITENR